MDKIIINDIEIYAYHGVFDEEKLLGQKFLISLELWANLKKAGISDELTDTIDYGQICVDVEIDFTYTKYNLIEKAAEVIAENILVKYKIINCVKVLIKKPSAPVKSKFGLLGVEIYRKWSRVYLSLGSNQGDKEKNLKCALELINNKKNRVNVISNFYKTTPVGYKDQDDFLNCCVHIDTLLSPDELINFLMDIEMKLKRERNIKWGPRTIDIDVLLYENEITSSEKIILPHIRMHERLFVLEPLCEIAPYVLHPILNKRVIEIRDELRLTQKL